MKEITIETFNKSEERIKEMILSSIKKSFNKNIIKIESGLPIYHTGNKCIISSHRYYYNNEGYILARQTTYFNNKINIKLYGDL